MATWVIWLLLYLWTGIVVMVGEAPCSMRRWFREPSDYIFAGFILLTWPLVLWVKIAE